MRNEKASKKFLNADGTHVAHANPNAVALVISFANGKELVVEPKSFNQSISTCLLLHGISQKLGDSYASTSDADEAYDKAANLFEALSGEDGEWLQRGEAAGPRVTVLAEAVARAKPEKYPTVESAVEMLAAKSKDEKKAIAANKVIAAAMAEISAERAMERAEKAKAEAGGNGGADIADI